jgi:hypothetical protein
MKVRVSGSATANQRRVASFSLPSSSFEFFTPPARYYILFYNSSRARTQNSVPVEHLAADSCISLISPISSLQHNSPARPLRSVPLAVFHPSLRPLTVPRATVILDFADATRVGQRNSPS